MRVLHHIFQSAPILLDLKILDPGYVQRLPPESLRFSRDTQQSKSRSMSEMKND